MVCASLDRSNDRRNGTCAQAVDSRVSGSPAFLGASRIRRFASVAFFLLPTLTACATSFGNPSTVAQTIGRATLHDIEVEVPEILGSNGFSIHERHRTGGAVTFETNWMYRSPLEDEAERGASAARTRVIVAARRSAGHTYTVRVRAENEVQGAPPNDDSSWAGWYKAPATEMYEAYARELFLRIKLRIDAGVRVR